MWRRLLVFCCFRLSRERPELRLWVRVAFAFILAVAAGKAPAQGLIPLDEETYRSLPHAEPHRAFLPASVDLSHAVPTPGDQGDQGSCTGWAVGYAARTYYEARRPAVDPDDPAHIASPSFIYNRIREGDCDAGSSIGRALNLLEMRGALALAEYPYHPDRCNQPMPEDWQQRARFRIGSWLAIRPITADNVKGQLANSHPVIISLPTDDAFEDLGAGRVYDGTPLPQDWHAVTLVGYDERRQAFRLINSWGSDWADGGFGWLSYDSFERIVRGAYVLRPKEAPPRPAPPPEPEPTPAPPQSDLRTEIAKAGFECASLEVTARTVRGFVSSAADRERLRGIAADDPQELDVEVRPWPQCEALLTFAEAHGAADAPRLAVAEGRHKLEAGDRLVIEVTTPKYPSYLYLAYVQADGTAVYLHQPTGVVPRPTPPGTTLRLGDGSGGGPTFTVGPPFGEEMIVAVAAGSPLFDEPRPRQETERAFLTAFRRAVMAALPGRSEPRHLAAAHVAITTRE